MRAADYPLQVWDPLVVGNQAPRTFISGRLCVHQGVGHARIMVHSLVQLHALSFSSFAEVAPVDRFQDHL